jgi:hypothetical protein
MDYSASSGRCGERFLNKTMGIKLFAVKKHDEPGFRLNLADFIFIVFLIALSYIIFSLTKYNYFYLLPLYIGFTFFLFCNVFRIGNSLEVFWYVPFLGVSTCGFFMKDNFWPLVLLICEPLKAALIIFRIRKGNYIGAFYKQLGKFSRL